MVKQTEQPSRIVGWFLIGGGLGLASAFLARELLISYSTGTRLPTTNFNLAFAFFIGLLGSIAAMIWGDYPKRLFKK